MAVGGGGELLQADLDSLDSDTAYSLCIYDELAGVASLAAEDGPWGADAGDSRMRGLPRVPRDRVSAGRRTADVSRVS